MLQADVLVDLVGAGVDRERRRRGAAQDLDFAVADLDLAGRQVVVDRALGPHTDRARDLQDVLAAHIDVVVDDALDDARVVAQVDECQVLAVLTATTDPAAHADRAADVGLAQLTTQVGTHRCCLSRGRGFSHEFRFPEREFLRDVRRVRLGGWSVGRRRASA